MRCLLSEFSLSFHVFHGHSVSLVDHVDLIWSLYSWWEGFGLSSLLTLPLDFSGGFISTSACDLSTGVLLLRLPWRTWVCPSEGQVEGGAVAWVMGALATPATQGNWQLGQQEIQCSRRGYQAVLANALQYSCLEKPLTEKPGRVTNSWRRPKWPCVHRCETIFCLWQLCSSKSWAWIWHSFLACGGSSSAERADTRTASAAGGMALSESIFGGGGREPLVAGNQKASLASLSP